MELGASPDGNWAGEQGPTNVLWRPEPSHDVDDARRVLFEAREARIRPATDDKVLAAWNGMAICALAETGRAFAEPRYVRAAIEAAEFVLEHLRDPDGRLLRSWRDGVPGRPGFSDDHALMASACLTLYETTFDTAWFERASDLGDELRNLFADRDGGGFFQTGSDARALLVRPKELYDNATPSGNSVAADVLLRLSAFTGDASLERDAVSSLRLVSENFVRAPGAFGAALCALDRLLGPHRQVAVIGAPRSNRTQALVAETSTLRFRPNLVLAVADPDDERASRAIPLLRDRAPDRRDADGLRLRRVHMPVAGDRCRRAGGPARHGARRMIHRRTHQWERNRAADALGIAASRPIGP